MFGGPVVKPARPELRDHERELGTPLPDLIKQLPALRDVLKVCRWKSVCGQRRFVRKKYNNKYLISVSLL